MRKQVTLKGNVSEIAWRNPHVVIYMEVKDEAGKLVTWGFENSNVSSLAREGYNRNTLQSRSRKSPLSSIRPQPAPFGIVVKIIWQTVRK